MYCLRSYIGLIDTSLDIEGYVGREGYELTWRCAETWECCFGAERAKINPNDQSERESPAVGVHSKAARDRPCNMILAPRRNPLIAGEDGVRRAWLFDGVMFPWSVRKVASSLTSAFAMATESTPSTFSQLEFAPNASMTNIGQEVWACTGAESAVTIGLGDRPIFYMQEMAALPIERIQSAAAREAYRASLDQPSTVASYARQLLAMLTGTESATQEVGDVDLRAAIRGSTSNTDVLFDLWFDHSETLLRQMVEMEAERHRSGALEAGSGQ